MNEKTVVNVVGLGYIGLPTALIMAANGVSVVGTDKNPSLVEKLQGGSVTFEEDGLEELYQKAVEGKIRFSASNI